MSSENTNTVGTNLGGRVGSALVLLALSIVAAFTLLPIYMCLLNSLKTEGEILNDILAIPSHFVFTNYTSAFQETRYLRSLWNTVVAAAVGLTGIILFGSMAGYKLSRTKSRLSGFVFGLFVIAMLIPFHSIMITLYKVAKNLAVKDSITGLGLIYVGLGIPMAVFLYHGFTKSIPRELEEAAVIDGCGEFRMFFTIIFPLLLPITATIVILNALWIWNDFLLPLLMLTDSDQYTLVLSTNILFGQYGNNEWSAILAALVMAMLPAIVLYLLLQKYITKGIAEGAIKG